MLEFDLDLVCLPVFLGDLDMGYFLSEDSLDLDLVVLLLDDSLEFVFFRQVLPSPDLLLPMCCFSRGFR